jgi:hypothetical protein
MRWNDKEKIKILNSNFCDQSCQINKNQLIRVVYFIKKRWNVGVVVYLDICKT